ncbi:MAG TPA: hypothetical protein QGH16_08485 [Verrucomicrobiota bacterium]|nr:hypothetical protein [Verrucomicrobiota bacterium]
MNINLLIRTNLLLLGLAMLVCCSNSKQSFGNMSFEWSSDKRSYTAIARTKEGNEMVQVECRFVGKKPDGKLEESISRDYRHNPTDFYHYKFINLTDKTITLESVDYRFDRGRYKKIFQRKTRSDIADYMNSNILEPQGTLERRNSWVWGKFNPDVLHKIYHAKADGEELIIDVHLTFK